MKKLLPIALLLMGTIISAASSKQLDYAEYLADKHIIVRQRPNTNYRLDDNVLRQEVVGIAIRLTSLNFKDVETVTLPEPYTCENIFTDVGQDRPNTWVCRSVEMAAKNKIISTFEKQFRPEQYITQAEAIAMVLAAVKLTPEIDPKKPWQDSIMSFSQDLGIIDAGVSQDALIKRGELFELISRVTKILYKREIIFLENL